MTLSESTTVTKLNIGYIGIGNAGSQIGIEVHKNGIPVRLINTSTKDLDQSIIPADVGCYLIADDTSAGRGAGHSRDSAKKLYRSGGRDEKVLNDPTFTSFINENDVIVVGASTAGGTGSGIAPTLVYQLKTIYPTKAVILLGVMPRVSATPSPQYNTTTFCDEINQLNNQGVGITYMLYDLEKYKDISDDTAYKMLAETIAKSLRIIGGSMSRITTHGMIDERDMLTIICEPGLMNIYFKEDIDMSKIPEGTGIQEIMEETVKEFPCVSLQKDKIAKWYGMFLNLPEDVDDPVRRSDFSTIEKVLGKPWDTFINLSVTDKPKGEFGIIVSGLSYPFDRINACLDIVKSYASNVKTKAFDIAGELSSVKGLAKNDNIDKILGSNKNPTPEDKPANIAMPSFLDPDF